MKQNQGFIQNSIQNYKLAGLVSLTLGLAPFSPEPHIWGKIKWLAGGAKGMKGMDYFDTLLHGFPWVWLAIALILTLRSKLKT